MKRGVFIGVSPAYTGVVFLSSWMYLLFYANSAGIEAAAPVSLMSVGYLVSAVFMVAMLLVVSFAPINRVVFLSSMMAKVSAPVLVSLGSVAMIMGGFGYGSIALTIVGAVMTGIGSGLMGLQWVMAYRRVGLAVLLGSFPTLTAMSVGSCLTLFYLPREALLLATTLFPVVSAIMFHAVCREPWPEDDLRSLPRSNRLTNYALLFVPIFVYSLASGFLDYFSSESYYTFVFYALIAFVPLIVSGVSIYKSMRQGFLSAFVVPMCFLVVMFVPFLSLHDVAPMAQFVSIGELGIEVLAFVVLVGFAEFFSISVYRTYAFGRLILAFVNSVGWYIAEAAVSTFGGGGVWASQLSLVAVMIGVEVLAVCLVAAIVKTRQELRLPEELEAEEVAVAAGADQVDGQNDSSATGAGGFAALSRMDNPEGFQTQCAAIAQEHGLSARECDVFILLARGYSSARIQSELHIAPGTVNYHARNIYAKLDVHSKQELISLVDRKTTLAEGVLR